MAPSAVSAVLPVSSLRIPQQNGNCFDEIEPRRIGEGLREAQQVPIQVAGTRGSGRSSRFRHHFGSAGTNGTSSWSARRPVNNLSMKSFWEGGEQLLQHVVQDLSAAEGSGALSQIGSAIAPAIDGTLSQIGSTIAPAIDGTSELQRIEIGSLAAVGWFYITASPGVLLGAFDTFLVAPFQSVLDSVRGRRSWNATDFIVGEWIGEGSFGTVYTGALLSKTLKASGAGIGKRTTRMEELKRDAKFEKVVLKKVKVRVEGAEECAQMEEWFNSRVCRAAPSACAQYLGSFIADITRGQFVQGGKWLVWKYEGTMTLAAFMKQPSFPDKLEEIVFGSKGLSESNPVRRRAILIQKIMRQLLTSVKKLHSIGIVHRDIKPSNLVVTQTGKLKVIDFGAAIDLRTGRNFNPDQGMLDPDYCPPERFVMPEDTPRPPVVPLAAILSPFLWIMNSPDLFDTYSVGIILMELACSNLRTPIGQQSFKTEMAAAGYDLDKWRRTTKMKTSFEVLDLDGGRAWDLAKKLLCKRGTFRRGRLSAAAALRHPYFLFGRDQVASLLSKITPAKAKP